MAKKRNKKGGTPPEEWELLAERTNKFIDLSKVENEKDYQQKLAEVFSRNARPDGSTPNWFPSRHLRDVMENNRELKKILEKRQAEEEATSLSALRTAQRLEKARPLKSRIRDESRTHKRTLAVTRRNVGIWKKGRYVRSDLKGIDTRLPKPRRGNDANRITGKDLKLPKNVRVTIDSTGIKRYRSGNGQFLSNKKIRQLQMRKKRR